ncbi:Palmitoyltransferase [Xanthoria calcicola]
MLYLEYFLYIRLAILFQNRSLPSYLGPTPIQMISLFTFTLTNSITLFALAVLLIRNIYTLASNTTTIESWEIERHDTLVRRARSHGGYLDGPDGQKIRIQRQEFPYDIGIYANVRQAMGTGVWTWLWPFAATPANERGLAFETNGFEDPNTTWPPPDPDRLPRRTYNLADLDDPFIHTPNHASNIDIDAFRTRQRRDYRRFSSRSEENDESQFRSGDNRETGILSDVSEHRRGEAWKDKDGDCLGDFGVDDEGDEDEDDDVPLSEILARRGRGGEVG